MQLETIPIPLAAGQVFPIALGGNRFVVLSAPYTLTEVSFVDENGGSGGSMRNIGEGAYSRASFAGVTITNGPTAQTVRIIIATGDAGTNQLPGVVRVVDQGAEKTIGASQFFGSSNRAVDAVKFGLAGILAGSKSVAVKRLQIFSSNTGRVAVWSSTGAPTDTAAASSVSNKLIGGASALTQRYTALAATVAPSAGELPGGTSRASLYVPANTTQEFPLTTPIVLAPGQGLFAVGPAINTEVSMVFDLEELA